MASNVLAFKRRRRPRDAEVWGVLNMVDRAYDAALRLGVPEHQAAGLIARYSAVRLGNAREIEIIAGTLLQVARDAKRGKQ